MPAVPEDDLPDSLRGSAVPEDDLPTAGAPDAGAGRGFVNPEPAVKPVGGGRGFVNPPSVRPEKPYRIGRGGDAEVFEGALPGLVDIAKGASRAVAHSGSALAQLLEKPVTAGVNAAAGRQVLPGNYAERYKEWQDQQIGDTSPIGDVVGGGLALAVPAGKLAEGAAALPQVLPRALGGLERAAKAGTAGGALAVASEPVTTGPDASFTGEKGKQFGMGAALGALGQAVPDAYRAVRQFGKDLMYGTPGAEQLRLWDRVKDLGFEIRPRQARQDASRMMHAGLGQEEAVHNQGLANTLASKETGEATHALTPGWFKRRNEDLGRQFDDAYKLAPQNSKGEHVVNVDLPAIQGLKDYAAYEQSMGYPWMTSKAKSAADKLVGEFEAISAGQARVKTMRVSVDDIQRLRTELSNARQATNDKIDRRGIGEIIDAIDESVARNHPALKTELDRLRPQYRTLKTLEEGAQRGVVDAQGNISLDSLGQMMRAANDRYIRGESGHPLQELAQLGESFGIRSIGQARTTAGKGLRSGAMSDEVPSTKAELIRGGWEWAKAMNPLYRRGHNKYMGEYDPAARIAPVPMRTGAIFAGGVGGGQPFSMADAKNVFIKPYEDEK